MLLWFGFAVLAAAVIAALLWPLLRSAPARLEPEQADVAVYREQLRAIEADEERGLLEASETEAARTELARRLLRAASAGEVAAAAPVDQPQQTLLGKAAYGLAAVVPIAGLIVYLLLGSPGLPGLPHKDRLAAPATNRSVEDLIGLVEARLRQKPDDAQGWEVIAPVYARVGRYRDAAIAYGRSLEINGESAKRLTGLAEALILAENGVVGGDARRVLKRLREIAPETPEPRFWLAMAKEQDGDLPAAIADLEAMLAAGKPDAPWREMVSKRVAELKATLADAPADRSASQSASGANADPALGPALGSAPGPKPGTPVASDAQRPSAPPATGRVSAPASGPAAGRMPGPSEEQVAAAREMSPTDRAQMIDRMVKGLAERLEKNGRDLEGWLRLVRAYKVMGREADARAALDKARKGLAGDDAALKSIDALGAELGLGS